MQNFQYDFQNQLCDLFPKDFRLVLGLLSRSCLFPYCLTLFLSPCALFFVPLVIFSITVPLFHHRQLSPTLFHSLAINQTSGLSMLLASDFHYEGMRVQ